MLGGSVGRGIVLSGSLSTCRQLSTVSGALIHNNYTSPYRGHEQTRIHIIKPSIVSLLLTHFSDVSCSHFHCTTL